MNLKVLKPGRVIVDEDVKSVTLPGLSGEITPMDGHDLLVTVLSKGKMHFVRSEEEEGETKREYFDIDGGIAEITHTAVIVFVHDAVKERETSEPGEKREKATVTQTTYVK